MSDLRTIHRLLQEEYAISRHLFWWDEDLGKWVNDVTQTLWLIRRAVEGVQKGYDTDWRKLVEHCLDRSMSYPLMAAIGEYLRLQVHLEALPQLDLTESPSSLGRIEWVELGDEREQVRLSSWVACPEPDRRLSFKHDHAWTPYPPRLREEAPQPEARLRVHRQQHWLML